MEELTQEQFRKIEANINQWKVILGLGDWQIDINRLLGEDDVFASILNNFPRKEVAIQFTARAFINDEILEDTIIHELLHLVISSYSKRVDILLPENKIIEDLEEEVVERLTKIMKKL